ncbi:aa3-type cytochrome oxidase subunit CtaJ [Mycolicibacterium brumae]|uniref:Uncharacterized protein n=1 Tax=Mycolicibacterium brumae TaxID=85968 RepID=A0A2G5PBS2_9MYCO|nr:hypothetical protein [Mycolicibacterium brumae]MCV7191448.1 hypothetical protein [Mycolicibacterium brumae]PIB75808.1 hypothetical protein CQY22_008370 [Mycolicibacterium brumae]UWW09444.1 hypothetical protein L2Z93_002544 [Mycolicibacterium brumae]
MIIGGVPVALYIVLYFWTHIPKPNRPDEYKLGEKWTYGPILWAATDEVVGSGHGHGHGHDNFTVGGGASGKW